MATREDTATREPDGSRKEGEDGEVRPQSEAVGCQHKDVEGEKQELVEPQQAPNLLEMTTRAWGKKMVETQDPDKADDHSAQEAAGDGENGAAATPGDGRGQISETLIQEEAFTRLRAALGEKVKNIRSCYEASGNVSKVAKWEASERLNKWGAMMDKADATISREKLESWSRITKETIVNISVCRGFDSKLRIQMVREWGEGKKLIADYLAEGIPEGEDKQTEAGWTLVGGNNKRKRYTPNSSVESSPANSPNSVRSTKRPADTRQSIVVVEGGTLNTTVATKGKDTAAGQLKASTLGQEEQHESLRDDPSTAAAGSGSEEKGNGETRPIGMRERSKRDQEIIRVRARSDMQYVELVQAMRAGITTRDNEIVGVRRAANGRDAIIVIGNEGDARELQDRLTGLVVVEEAVLVNSKRTRKVLVKNMDAAATKEELLNALVSVTKTDEIRLVFFKEAKWDTRSACIELPEEVAGDLLRMEPKPRIKVGWTFSPLREFFDVRRCYYCNEPGHLAAEYSAKAGGQGEVCFVCGDSGHRAKDCKSRKKCNSCLARQQGDPATRDRSTRHKTGTWECWSQKELIDEARVKNLDGPRDPRREKPRSEARTARKPPATGGQTATGGETNTDVETAEHPTTTNKARPQGITEEAIEEDISNLLAIIRAEGETTRKDKATQTE